MNIKLERQSVIERTHRVQMLETMFEVPSETKLSVSLSGTLPIEEKPWNIGLIVGPSGSGKTLLLNEIFAPSSPLGWGCGSVIDDFPSGLSMEDIARICQSVGFNTIPSWLRPYNVLSNGERFRVEMARRLLDDVGVITVDEFTSVVDRQVAQFACHGIQKYVREKGRKLVVASCHYDIIDWLQPDWILEPGKPCRFSWRSLRQRPPITVSVSRVKYETWNLFKDFHYMSQDLNRAARCYGLFVIQPSTGVDNRLHDDGVYASGDRDLGITGASPGPRVPSGRLLEKFGGDTAVVRHSRRDTEVEESDSKWYAAQPVSKYEMDTEPTEKGRIASMCGILHRPHPKVRDIMGFTRMVTLPDFQGLGLAFVLANTVASAYKALGKRLHSYPNHPAWIRSYQRSKDWMQVKEAGNFSPSRGSTSTVGGFGGRRCAVFMYIGPAGTVEEAQKLIHPEDV